jgi:hypothetical protein
MINMILGQAAPHTTAAIDLNKQVLHLVAVSVVHGTLQVKMNNGIKNFLRILGMNMNSRINTIPGYLGIILKTALTSRHLGLKMNSGPDLTSRNHRLKMNSTNPTP